VRKKYFNPADHPDCMILSVQELTKMQQAASRSWLESQLGKPYDYYAVLRFITRTKSIANDSRFCSELVVLMSRMAGLVLLARVDPERVSPTMLSYSPELI
jgi:uncharacterized protein YycO